MKSSTNYSTERMRELKTWLSEEEKQQLATALEAKRLEGYDSDAYILASGDSRLSGTVNGDLDLVASPIYAHGRELKKERAASSTHSKLEAYKTAASREFAVAFGRVPESGDVLSYRQLELCEVMRLFMLDEFVEAWSRQLPNTPCPIRRDGMKTLKLQKMSPLVAVPPQWVEDTFESLERRWSEIQREAGANDSIGAVLFLDKEHCRPATEAEQEMSEAVSEPKGGILAALATVGIR